MRWILVGLCAASLLSSLVTCVVSVRSSYAVHSRLKSLEDEIKHQAEERDKLQEQLRIRGEELIRTIRPAGPVDPGF